MIILICLHLRNECNDILLFIVYPKGPFVKGCHTKRKGWSFQTSVTKINLMSETVTKKGGCFERGCSVRDILYERFQNAI